LNGTNNKFWYLGDQSESNKFGDNTRWVLLIDDSEHRAELGEPNTSGLHHTKHEGSSWLIEGLWLAKSILHHIDSISGIWKALPLEDQGNKEQAEINWG